MAEQQGRDAAARRAVADHGPVPRATPEHVRRDDLVARTVAAARDHAATLGADQPDGALRAPHPAAPAVGTRAVVAWPVTDADTAAAVGHPDPTVDVLSSPTLGLWFELSSGPVMPDPAGPHRHVGVGLVVHHLDLAHVGDEVEVAIEVVAVAGRSVVMACDAWCDGRLVATGVHHRVVLERERRRD